MLRGDVYELRLPKGRGHEQRGRRFGVLVQADEFLPRSMVLLAPTSQSARPASFRPEIEVNGELTRVLVEQVGAVDAGRLGGLRRSRRSGAAVGDRRGAAHGVRASVTSPRSNVVTALSSSLRLARHSGAIRA